MVENAQIFGTWVDMHTESPSSNQMVLDATHLSTRWRRCSLSSDFWARYTSLFVPEFVQPGMLSRDAIESVLSYLLNELFENCAKFSAGPVQTVCYQSWIFQDWMVFQVTNHIDPRAQGPFTDLIHELLEGDPDELYFQRLEESVELNLSGSGLGYLTLIKDYGIRFGFRFQPVGPGSVAVDVQAHVSMEED